MIGFIGVGKMGASLAGRLVDGGDLLVYDRHAPAADDLVARGARFAGPEQMVAECDVVLTCLPAPTHVRDLFLGEGGLAAALRSGTLVIDMTTSTPLVDQEIAAALRERGVDFVDAPIAGGTRRVSDGKATLMVGATADAYPRAAAILHRITPDVVHVGDIGAGHTMKLVNNMLNACNRIAAMESIRIGEAHGIRRDVLIDVLNRGSGRNYTTETTYPQLLSGPEPLPTNFALELYLKDVRLANEIAAAAAQDNRIGRLVESGLEHATAALGGQTDISDFTAHWSWPED